MPTPGRNDVCHCGSGQKYKKCCWSKDEETHTAQLTAQNAARNEEAKSETAATPPSTRKAAPQSFQAPKGPLPGGGPKQNNRRKV